MYKLLLISKYLRRKLAPLFAAVAVTICTAMVIIVASVMGGFLGLMETTAKQLTPDVVIQSPSLTGFAGYEELIEQLEALPEVELASAAVVSPASATFSDLNYPQTREVVVQGIMPRAYNQIVPYDRTLMWSADDMLGQYRGADFRLMGAEPDRKQVDLKSAGENLRLPAVFQNPAISADQQPGTVIGIALSPFQSRAKDGSYSFDNTYIGGTITLAMPVFSARGQPMDVSQPQIRVVNEFKSGYYEVDSKLLFVPFDWLQKQLKMQRFEEYTDFDEATGLGGDAVIREARCTHVYVKAAEGIDEESLRAACEVVVSQFENERPGTLLQVLTWRAVHGTLLGAVKNEKGMVTFLFTIISLVAIIMVATTFYMIVLEKTRDIGVLRAIGAPASGVLNLFLAYGLAIGLIGAGLGVWLAWFTVSNLNNLQGALANRLGTLIVTVCLSLLLALIVAIGAAYAYRRRDFSLGAGVLLFLSVFVALMAITYYTFPHISLPGISSTLNAAEQLSDGAIDPDKPKALDERIGWRMWDPQLYFFEKIPDQVDWNEVFWIWVGAVVSSVLGAIIPAVIAARLNPVEALRYE